MTGGFRVGQGMTMMSEANPSNSTFSFRSTVLWGSILAAFAAVGCTAPAPPPAAASDEDLSANATHVSLEGAGADARYVVECAAGNQERYKTSDYPFAAVRGIPCTTRPAIRAADSYILSNVEGDTRASPDFMYRDALGDGKLSDVLHGYGLFIPAVSRQELLTPTWGQPGSRRLVVFADGNLALEEIVDVTPDTGFRYMVWKFTSPATVMIDHALAQFEYDPTPSGGTHIRWQYGFEARSPASLPLLKWFVDTQYQPFMQQAMTDIVTTSEKAQGK
jgi:hypothetical protein